MRSKRIESDQLPVIDPGTRVNEEKSVETL